MRKSKIIAENEELNNRVEMLERSKQTALEDNEKISEKIRKKDIEIEELHSTIRNLSDTVFELSKIASSRDDERKRIIDIIDSVNPNIKLKALGEIKEIVSRS